MPASYRSMIGIATITCEITSGGVIKAARINTTTIACLRYFFNNSGLTKPSLVEIKITTGSSKKRPDKKRNSPFVKKINL